MQGLLHLPIPLQHSQDFPVLQYADDTLVIMEDWPNQIAALQTILQDFYTSTGSKVNFAKSSLVPINLEPDRAASLAQQFGCILGSLPFILLLKGGSQPPLVLSVLKASPNR